MLKLRNPHERAPRARRFGRSARSIAALAITTLVAPAAIATIAASPAGAAAPRVYVVAGDALARTATGGGTGSWSLHHPTDFAELRSLITDGENFGPDGTVKTQFTIGEPLTEPITAAKLANIDVYFSGAIEGSGGVGVEESYTAAEITALQTWVAGGGIIIFNQNSATWSTAGDVYGLTMPVEGIFEGGAVSAGLNGGYEAPFTGNVAAAARQANASTLMDGPFGDIDRYSMFHTVAGFNAGSLPVGSNIVARVTTPVCTVSDYSCQNPTNPVTTPPPAPPTPQPYNNYLNNLVSLATYETGSGAVVFTSDVDTYSNHYSANGLTQPGGGGAMTANNRTLALNTFAWVADQLAQNNPVDGYTPVTPTRWLDTRTGAPLADGGKLHVDMAGTSRGSVSIPADATGVVLNVTATQPTGVESYLTVYPTPSDPAASPPESSNLNFRAGGDVANAVTVTVGDDGRVSFYNDSGTTHLLIDVVGYFQPTTGERLTSTSPSRVLDTRNAIGSDRSPIGEGESRVVQITGGVVPNGSSAVVLNVTASEGTRGGYVSVVPGDQTGEPTTSSVNFLPNTIKANLVVVPLAADGTIRVFNKFGTTAVIADVLGFYSDNGGTFAQLTPTRLLDTRTGVGITVGKLGTQATLEFDVRGRGGVPAHARSVLLNVTAASPDSTSYLTVFPQSPRPEASNLNFTAGAVVPNLVLANIGDDGKVRIYNDLGTVDVIADVVAWFD